MTAKLIWFAFAISSVLAVTGVTNTQAETTTTHSGVIRSLNIRSRRLTVEGTAAVMTFQVPTDAAIIVKDKTTGADLSDLMVGDKIEVQYTTDGHEFIAHRIAVLGVK